VSVAPSSFTLAPNTSQQVVISVSGATPSSATLAVTATAGATSKTTQVTLAIGVAAPISFRTRFVRTDAVTPYFLWINNNWSVFHAATSRLFATDPEGNAVYAIDTVTQTRVAKILVPGAYGIDDSPDHSTLWVGTLVGDVYSIDPVSMTVKQRYRSSQIGPFSFHATNVAALADGRLALLGPFGGLPSIDGAEGVVFWDPVANTTQVPPCGNGSGIGRFQRTPDRKKIVYGGVGSPGNALCISDSTTGTGTTVFTETNNGQFFFSPDGNYIVVPKGYGSAVVYDARTLAKVREFQVLGDTSTGAWWFFGADPNILFAPNDATVYAYDLRNGQRVGWVPNVVVSPASAGFVVGPLFSPAYISVGSGLVAGPQTEGVGFLDLSTLRTGPVGIGNLNGYLQPATGPTAGGTTVTWTGTISPVVKAFLGQQQGVFSKDSNGLTQFTTPAGSTGPADFYALTADGGMQMLPEAFSYGPTIMQVVSNASFGEGGGVGSIYGYGFGPANSNAIPSGVHVTVGGIEAPLLAFDPNAYGISSQPFLLQGIIFQFPVGVSPTADVTVITPSGSATKTGAVSYLRNSVRYPLPGASLRQGIYDRGRDLYYFTDITKVQVFSRSSGWKTPITVPGASSLWGISLSPDGTKLAVGDEQANVIFVINPADPTSVSSHALPGVTNSSTGPTGLAVTDQGAVYFARYVNGCSGCTSFFKLDTNNDSIKDYGINNSGSAVQDHYLRAIASNDNSRVYFDNSFTYVLDTGTDNLFVNTDVYGRDLALSSNQTHLASGAGLLDSDLNTRSSLTLNVREGNFVDFVYGMKLSPDGSMLFQPTTTGIDVYDARVGVLLYRIGLGVELSTAFDALVSNGRDNVLLGITGSGDGVIELDLNQLAAPAPLPFMPNLRYGMPASQMLSKAAAPVATKATVRSTPAYRTQVPKRLQ
jgi:WD40-like Beta Propeller Repeat